MTIKTYEDAAIRSARRAIIEDLLDAGGASCLFVPRGVELLNQAAVLSGAAIDLTASGTPYEVTHVVLPAGTWDVSGFIGFLPDTLTSITALAGSSSATTAQIDTGSGFVHRLAAVVPGVAAIELPLAARRYALPSGGTVYLNARATFSISTLGAFGRIEARLVTL